MKLSFLVQININDDDQPKLDLQVVANKLLDALAEATGHQLVALQGADINYLGAK